MFGGDTLMAVADRHGLRGLQKAFRAVGEFFEVHLVFLSLSRSDGVAF
jgi:hypothetical protein